MLNTLNHLFDKLASLRGGPAAAGQQNTTPAWPAPVPKPGAVIPKLALARRSDRADRPAATPLARPETLVLHRSGPAR